MSRTGANAETISDTGDDDRIAARPCRPCRLHRQRILADRDRDAERRTQFFAYGLDGGVQRRVLARLAAGRHPVRRQPHLRERVDVGCENVRDRLARPPARPDAGPSSKRDWRALAHRHRLAGIPDVVRCGHGDIRHRHLPWADQLIARDQSTDGAIADRDEECLVGNGRQRKQTRNRIAQWDCRRIETTCPASERSSRPAASSAPCRAQRRPAYRPAGFRNADLQASIGRRR